MSEPSIMVIDLGTTSVRVCVVGSDGTITATRRMPMSEGADGPGSMCWDAQWIAETVLGSAAELCAQQPVAGVAVATQRTSCLLWDRRDGTPLTPVIGWPDARARPLERRLRAEGVPFIAGLTAGKLRYLLDTVDPDRTRSRRGEILAGTLDSWLAWILTEGALHITDHTNASHTGLLDLAGLDWNEDVAAGLKLPGGILARTVACDGPFGPATALPGQPPLLAVIADQQASLLGQGCETMGAAKITLGTVGAINVRLDDAAPPASSAAIFANVALSDARGTVYGVETSFQSAGSSVDWLVRLGLLESPSALDRLVDPGVRNGDAVFVPALYGLGAPHWKPQARGAFLGLSGADAPADIARAVLDGIVCSACEAIELLEGALDRRLAQISVDGGLSASAAFTAILARTAERQFHRASAAEATTRGAAILARRALGLPDLTQTAGAPICWRDDTLAADRGSWAAALEQVLMETNRRSADITQRKRMSV
ncbi:FGGY family carbohydrate kinase [Nitratireductor sp. StC3]|uniref:FGGY family carbohydrate kinase n=1 Tax=Nitratireductor sp. StC3 TaxID=2126741 RepID=UPI001304F877|nr:FGGY family carbohydrate kinase [Nitratireductor sp. StC3]